LAISWRKMMSDKNLNRIVAVFAVLVGLSISAVFAMAINGGLP